MLGFARARRSTGSGANSSALMAGQATQARKSPLDTARPPGAWV